MDLELTDMQRMIKKNLKEFFAREIEPLVAEYENAGRFVTKEIVKKLVPHGYLGGLLPEEAGGFGLDYTTYFQMIEELSRAWPSLRAAASISNAVLTHIYEYGSPEQRERFLGPLLQADKIGFFALTEPNVGSDAASIETTAVFRGDHWVINGTKTFITNGVDGEVGLVIAQTDKSRGVSGIASFIVEKDKANYRSSPIHKMGMHSSETAELAFIDCAVPAENLLGEVGDGLQQGLKFLNNARAMLAFVCAGVAQACVELSVKYARERIQFGRPIGGFQLIQAKISDMETITSAMRLLGFQASSLLDKGKPCRKEASMAKLFATENVLRVAEAAVQIHGGYGYSREFPVERYYRDVRHLTMAEGTSEMQRLIIGREMLGISAFK